MYRISKRGQVTLFMALGLMLVFSVATLVAFRSIGEDLGKFKPYIEEVPTELQPLKSFVEKCVKDTLKEGLRELGAQGGYIDIEKEGILITNDPTNSGGVEFVPGIKVPYWYYLKSPNTCTGACNFDQSQTPNNKKIEQQLKEYVEENLQYCTRQFEQFPKFTIVDSQPEAEASIGVSNVLVNVLYPLEVSTGSRDTKISKFFIKADLNLRKMLDAARSIASVELEYQFLEYNDIELISTFSGVDSNLLPPFAASEMELKNIFWTTENVKQKLQRLLEEKYMILQAEGARNTIEPELTDIEFVESAQQLYRNFIVPFDYTNGLNVDFHYYADWPIYLSLNTGSPIVRPEQIMPSVLPFIPLMIEKYKTIYDMSHPVVIELEDPDAFNGEGYTFRFALETNIRGNEPLKFENNPQFTVPIGTSMMCDSDKRNSGEIHLQVLHSITNDPIPGVNVFFNSVESCAIGTTNENGELTAQFPVGIGTLGLIHKDYLPFEGENFVTELDTNKEAGKYRIKPLKDIKVAGEVFQLNRLGLNQWTIEQSPRALEKGETMMVMFERKKSSPNDPEFTRVAVFDKDSAQDYVQFVEGDYEVKVLFMSEENYTIPASQITEQMIMPMTPVEFMTDFKIYKHDLHKTGLAAEKPITFYGLFVNMPGAQGLTLNDISIFENVANKYHYRLVPQK